jgi:hypothetical protein
MGIHFYKKGAKNMTSVIEITDELYGFLEESLNTLEKKTGIFVDPYGKVNLYPENLKILYDIINSKIPLSNNNHINKAIENMLKKIQNLTTEKVVIEAVGD